MSVLDLPPLPRQWGEYRDFEIFIDNLHQAITPDCTPGFTQRAMRYSDGQGGYFYFPHPRDTQEVLSFALDLAEGADEVRRSLILPSSVIAGHPLHDDNGKVSRGLHAMLAGRTATEIERLGICRPHPSTITDTAAKAIVDLCPPEALTPHIKVCIYEAAGVEKHVNLTNGFEVSNEGVLAYQSLRHNLSEADNNELDAVISLSTLILWEGNKYLMDLKDVDSLEFALNAQLSKAVPMTDGKINFSEAMASLGEDGLRQFVADLWRYRFLRAKAAIACVGNTALGTRVVTLPDCDKPMSITGHYIRLTNNLVKERPLLSCSSPPNLLSPATT
jgi:hypothetical protein